MGKIVFTMDYTKTKKFYTQENLDEIRKLGELVLNMDEDGSNPDIVKELVKDAEVAITSWGSPQFDENILNSATCLKAVLHTAGSIKGIVSPELISRGIRVSNSAEALGMGVAETALGMTITSIKNIWQLSNSTRNGEWSFGKENVRELYNLKVGVIGAGYAGRHYIKLMHNFDVEILLYDPVVDAEKAKKLGVAKMELEKLLSESDIVSIHAPAIPATYRMINEERLALMKDNAILINTARGSIIDEPALIKELEKGRLFACLDVTEPEPPAADSPLRSLPNVILTPHIAGAVNNGFYRMGNYIVGELRSFYSGVKMRGEVDFSKIDTIA